MTQAADDVVRDTIALIESVHAEDVEAVQCLLDNADVRLVAVFAARVCCDVIEDWLLPGEPEMFSRVRRRYS